MPQILRTSPGDLFPPLGLDPMSSPPHGLPSPLIRTITETRHQHILWCLFPGFSRDPVDPPSHLSQCGLTSSFQRRGPGGTDKDDGSPKNKEVEDRASRRHSQSPVATPPPQPLALPHLPAPGGPARGLVLGTCGCALQQLQLGLESGRKGAAGSRVPGVQWVPPTPVSICHLLAADPGSRPGQSGAKAAGRGPTHVNKLSSRFRMRSCAWPSGVSGSCKAASSGPSGPSAPSMSHRSRRDFLWARKEAPAGHRVLPALGRVLPAPPRHQAGQMSHSPTMTQAGQTFLLRLDTCPDCPPSQHY